jgi:hypothetical protein
VTGTDVGALVNYYNPSYNNVDIEILHIRRMIIKIRRHGMVFW